MRWAIQETATCSGRVCIEAHQVDADTQQHDDQTSPASEDWRRLADGCRSADLTKSNREKCISEQLHMDAAALFASTSQIK